VSGALHRRVFESRGEELLVVPFVVPPETLFSSARESACDPADGFVALDLAESSSQQQQQQQ